MADRHVNASFSDSELLLKVGRRIWDNFPLLLLMDVVIVIAAVPIWIIMAGGLLALALPLSALIFGPLWAGITAAADRMNRDDALSLRAYFGLVRRYARAGIEVSVVPAGVATALVGTLSMMAVNPGMSWLIFPLLLDGSLAIITLVCVPAVYSLATTSGLRGWDLWRASLAVGIARPVITIGSLMLPVLLGLIVYPLAPLLLPVFLAPIAVVFSAATWVTVERYSPTASRS